MKDLNTIDPKKLDALPARAARRLLRTWKRRLSARRTIRTLHGLSDLQLKDIGMHRSEIERFGRDAANPAQGPRQ